MTTKVTSRVLENTAVTSGTYGNAATTSGSGTTYGAVS